MYKIRILFYIDIFQAARIFALVMAQLMRKDKLRITLVAEISVQRLKNSNVFPQQRQSCKNTLLYSMIFSVFVSLSLCVFLYLFYSFVLSISVSVCLSISVSPTLWQYRGMMGIIVTSLSLSIQSLFPF